MNNYDSDSSVDKLELEGRTFRLKFDCCKARRAGINLYKFLIYNK